MRIASCNGERQLAAIGGSMLWTIIAVLFALWLLGLIANVGGGLIHILLVVALVVVVFNLLSGRRTVV
jgi:hypothetical protein